MIDPIISVENLGKRYLLGQRSNERYVALRDVLTQKAQRILRRRNGQRVEIDNEIWALRGVTFEVKPGEVIGIIGRNGAGKSTLLKILSRITEPTEGSVRLKGRVASLLEVGTGFHPELTGRENIFLNGAILGMSRAEIREKFAEIVAFAETEKFLDTPVKRYSSGMYVRLAFAVAAHLEPEILIIDEVLAVGDAEFQKKCLGKMQDVSAKEGRTVLFVSHNLAAITDLCERAIWLDRGAINLEGRSRAVVAGYLNSSRATRPTWMRSGSGSSDSPIVLDAIRVTSAGNDKSALHFDEPIAVEIKYTVVREPKNAHLLARITDANGVVVFTSWDNDAGHPLGVSRAPGRYWSRCTIPPCLLRPGQYDLSIGVRELKARTWAMLDRVVCFEITEVGSRINPGRAGVITPILNWSTTRV